MTAEQIPMWAWGVALSLVGLLFLIIGALSARELKRLDVLYKEVHLHVQEEKAVWVTINNIDGRITRIEALANGKVQSLIGMVDRLTAVVERRLVERPGASMGPGPGA